MAEKPPRSLRPGSAQARQDLRKQAEKIARETADKSADSTEAMSPKEMRLTLHGLRVHQIELTMQNEELCRAQAELDASRERYLNLYDLAPVGYCTLSEKGLILEANLTAANLLGVTRKSLVQLLFTKFIIEEDRDIYYLHCKQLFDTGKPQVCDLRMVKKDGTSFWVRLEAITAQDVDGAPACRVVMSDTTTRKQQDVLSFHSQKLESVGQLAAGIAHEINTPIQFIGDNIAFMKDAFQDILSLTSILDTVKNDGLSNPAVARAFLSRIKEKEEKIDLDFLKKEIPQAIQQSLDGLQRVSTIVLAMREFSHPGGEEMSVLDINKAIESTIILTKNEWKYSADLIATLAPDLPIVQGYPGDFNQVILNIIVNAAQELQGKAGKDGSKKERIEISTRQDGNEVEICISDTGSGIPPEIQSRIFDPFFTTKAVGKGTGQGLAIAHNIIVKKHGGKIFFKTKVGEGTAFYIRLPLEKRRI